MYIYIQISQKRYKGEGDMKHKTKMSCLQFTLTFIYSTFCGKKRRGLFPSSHRHNTFIPSNVLFCGVRLLLVELETKVHPKVRNHGEGPY